jgi:hypothetical protein
MLVGEYHLGDGLGYHIKLSLLEDASFACIWSGCQGVYGEATGTWQRKGKVVRLRTDTATGKLKGYLKTADVIEYEGHQMLVLDEDKDFFRKHGASSYCCLHQEDTRAALNW